MLERLFLVAACLLPFGCSSTDGSGDDATGGGASLGGSSSGGANQGNAAGAGGDTAGPDGMRDITGLELVKDMKVGWNLGNTLDAPGGETAWGNPVTTQAMFDVLREAGFRTVRIPVTWYEHLGPAPDYVIDPAWLDRVEEVAGYALDKGMYAIINTHHDEWVSVMPDADQAAIQDELVKIWTQVATRFRDRDDHLLFETLNEPRTTDATEWTGGTHEARVILNGYNAAAVAAIRATGGNNAKRFVMIPTHGANSATECVDDLVIPAGDPRIIVSLHTYYPWPFCGDASGTAAFGSAADLTAMNTELDRIAALTVEKGQAAIIGEWASLDKNNTDARAVHAEAYAAAVRQRGLLPVWWDNNVIGSNGMGLLNRTTLDWYYPTIKDALLSGAGSVP